MNKLYECIENIRGYCKRRGETCPTDCKFYDSIIDNQCILSEYVTRTWKFILVRNCQAIPDDLVYSIDRLSHNCMKYDSMCRKCRNNKYCELSSENEMCLIGDCPNDWDMLEIKKRLNI